MSDGQSCFAGEKILVVDDDDVIVKLTVLLLKKWGFDTASASNGEECLAMVQKQHPALVLLDYMMPVMNGIDALKLIRHRYPDTYVIMFTGKGSEEVAVEIMKAGAADYLRKPFVNGTLQKRIEKVLFARKVAIENRELLHERELLQHEIKLWNEKLEQRVREKSNELELAHKEILQSEKLAALGHISAGMAHEIRNPLNSINLFAQILQTADGLDEENRGYVDKIIQEIERIDGILMQMLASSPDKDNLPLQVELPVVIDKVIDDWRARITRQNVELVLDVDRNVPFIEADALEIEQIFTNLIGNALYEMPDGGVLTISLHSNSEKVWFSVTDTGAGIPEENFKHIFDPFFTTKEKGTGFGLSVVMRIVTSCGGKVHAANLPGSGARFSVEIPLSSQEVN